MKVCKTCEISKEITEFYKSNYGASTFSSCKECVKKRTNKHYHSNLDKIKIQRKKHREENKEKIKEQKREYYKKNKERLKKKALAQYYENHEKRLAQKREYHQKHKERANAKRKQWNTDNPEKRRYSRTLEKAKRRVRMENQMGYMPDDYENILWEEQEGLCFYCLRELDSFHLEHMVPISKEGLHDISNVCLSCPDCNLAKGTKTAEEFLASCNFCRYNLQLGG
jgi:flagellar biosynthesis GTPase FlhF